jgi:formimidoylglutamate deiminase
MSSLYARNALLPGGWQTGVRLHTADGRFRSIELGASAAEDDFEVGAVIPGLCNAHSHAFQRALVGRTEQRSPEGKDNFWTWRNEMYRLANRLDPAMVETIARQLYSEMLAAGYTSVAEFHYLHSTAVGAFSRAAEATGIRLTLVPILYERAGFGSPEPDDMQKFFIKTFDEYVAVFETARSIAGDGNAVGVGLHSLRAVTEESIDRVAEFARTEHVPLHIHLAEQQAEVDECLSHYRTRPVRWLLNRCNVNENWCLVHATHVEDDEVADIAASGAVVCLCPSTEANLGDGLFPLKSYLDKGGRIAIGSDSHVTVDPFEELRWLEYGQRLATQSRNASVFDGGHTGSTLFDLVATGGALASGQQTGKLEANAYADLIVLDDTDPMLLGHDSGTLLDALVFSGYRVPVERVMVHGQWRVVDGRHIAADDYLRDYREVAEALR